MATTVNAAFAQFLRDIVNLDPEVTKTARTSRDWLMEQVHGFPSGSDDFPYLYSEMDIFFGSFARNTKIRELNDIDVMVAFAAYGAYYTEFGRQLQITVPQSNGRLYGLCTDGTSTLNSRRVINAIITALNGVPQYEKAEVNRRAEAATLKLKSYAWNFDVVPCFFTVPDAQGKTYYIIPDGVGHWKKTDPRRDRDVLAAVNEHFGGKLLNIIRLMKFWNQRHTTPAMPAYLLETMIVTLYRDLHTVASDYVDLEIPQLLSEIADCVLGPVYDLKGIQGDLNDLSWEDKVKIHVRAKMDHSLAVEARSTEQKGDQKGSISKWGEIFGPQFPSFGE